MTATEGMGAGGREHRKPARAFGKSVDSAADQEDD